MAGPIRNRRYLVVLALASGLVLIVGSMLRPKGREERTSPPTQGETSLVQLQRFTQRRTLDNQAEYLARLATQVDPHVFRLERAERTAVRWDEGRIIGASPSFRMPDYDVAFSGDVRVRAETLLAGPEAPAVILSVSQAELPPPPDRFAAGAYSVGGWAVAVWRAEGGQLAWRGGQYLGFRRILCRGVDGSALSLNLDLDPSMAGAGVFDLDGGLMGVIVVCEEGLAALGVSALEELATQIGDIKMRLQHRYGVSVEELGAPERKILGADYGFFVRQVWRGYEAYAAGLRPGDVIVGLEGSPTTSLMDLEPLVLPVARETLEVEISRFGRRQSLNLRARPSANRGSGPAGLVLSASAGLRIGDVDPQGPAARAGARPGDLLVSLDGKTAADLHDLDRAFSGESPVWAVFRRDERMWGALLARDR